MFILSGRTIQKYCGKLIEVYDIFVENLKYLEKFIIDFHIQYQLNKRKPNDSDYFIRDMIYQDQGMLFCFYKSYTNLYWVYHPVLKLHY